MVIRNLQVKSLICLIVLDTCIINAQDTYFQQEVNYRIDVTLDDSRNQLHAFEEIEYINNSPDTLAILYFHLWPNAYSSNRTDLARQLLTIGGKQKLFKDPRHRGWIDSLDFRVNNMQAETELLPGQPDICIIKLPASIYPGDTIYISTPFRVKVPEGNISRMGLADGAYQISQWYPKPAVFDLDGWHPMPYLDQGEFYSEFGKYDVTINLQEDYVVGASGDLQTVSEEAWLNETASQWRVPSIEQNRPSSLKTIHFTGENIHDFAWVAGKGFRALTGKIILP
ncbi:MAG: M1 family peptidase, partial [Chloroflexota bacterium]